MAHIIYNNRSFYYRANNFGDDYTIKENLTHHQYKQLKLSKDDVVLDLGGHIGTFAVSIASEVGNVFSVEMDVENYAYLKQNIAEYTNINIINVACVSQSASGGLLKEYRAAKNSGSHSLYVKRGRGDPYFVDGMSLSTIIGLIAPLQVTTIKCDVEGAEYDIFDQYVVPASVKQIVMELHLSKKGWKEEANKLRDNLVKQGFVTEYVDYASIKNWTKVVYFSRE